MRGERRGMKMSKMQIFLGRNLGGRIVTAQTDPDKFRVVQNE